MNLDYIMLTSYIGTLHTNVYIKQKKLLYHKNSFPKVLEVMKYTLLG